MSIKLMDTHICSSHQANGEVMPAIVNAIRHIPKED